MKCNSTHYFSQNWHMVSEQTILIISTISSRWLDAGDLLLILTVQVISSSSNYNLFFLVISATATSDLRLHWIPTSSSAYILAWIPTFAPLSTTPPGQLQDPASRLQASPLLLQALPDRYKHLLTWPTASSSLGQMHNTGRIPNSAQQINLLQFLLSFYFFGAIVLSFNFVAVFFGL